MCPILCIFKKKWVIFSFFSSHIVIYKTHSVLTRSSRHFVIYKTHSVLTRLSRHILIYKTEVKLICKILFFQFFFFLWMNKSSFFSLQLFYLQFLHLQISIEELHHTNVLSVVCLDIVRHITLSCPVPMYSV